MIISENKKNLSSDFLAVLNKADIQLKASVNSRENYFLNRSPSDFEHDVHDALVASARNTQFENTIQLISGHAFPDISIAKFYGVEVKTTKQQYWKSTGNSVFEATRIPDVTDIYIYFGKLSTPVGFKYRKYEECLYDIAVTHSPRYMIDMDTSAENNIFSKLGVEYEVLRKLPNPVKPFTDYYKKNLRSGESPWWIDSNEITPVPAVVRLFSNLDPQEKDNLILEAMILFPELFGASSHTKYNRISVWLAVQHGIVDSSLRDRFSAGGQEDIVLGSETYYRIPRVFVNFLNRSQDFFDLIKNYPLDMLRYYWDDEYLDSEDVIRRWTEMFWANALSNRRLKMKFLVHLIAANIPEEYKDIIKEECAHYDIKT